MEYICNPDLKDTKYATLDSTYLCLFIDSVSPPKKVVYSLTVDKFESLQVRGLYKLLEEVQD